MLAAAITIALLAMAPAHPAAQAGDPVPALAELERRADDLRRSGRWSEAVEAYASLAERQADALEEDSAELAETRVLLAECLVRAGSPADALAPARAGIAAIEERGLELTGEGLALRLKVVFVLTGAGRLSEAEERARRLVQDAKSAAPENARLIASARNNHGSLLRQLGRLREAEAAFAELVDELERRAAPDSLLLALARQNLGSCLAELGELGRSRAVLDEAWQAVSERPSSSRKTELRMTLASVLVRTGDHFLAQRHMQEMLAAWDDGDSPILRAGVLVNLAVSEQLTRALEDARTHVEEALALLAGRVSPDHPQLLLTRGVQVDILSALQEDVLRQRTELLADLEARLPPDHPDVCAARQDLAKAYSEAGDHESWGRILERQIEVLEASDEKRADGELALARWSLAGALASQGRRDDSLEVARRAAGELLDDARRDLTWMSPRVLRSRLESLRQPLDVLLSLALGDEGDEPDAALLEDMFTLVQLRQGAALVRARLASRLPPVEREALRAAREDLAREAAAGTSREAVRSAIDREERAWRPLAGQASVSDLASALPSPAQVERTLGVGEAVVAFQQVERRQWVSGAPGESILVAFLLRPGRPLECLDLGALDVIEEAVRTWRGALGVTAGAAGRGLSAGSASPSERDGEAGEEAAGEALRRRVLDPVLARLDAEVTRLVVANHGLLHYVPWDALPGPDGSGRVGDERAVEVRASLWRRTLRSEPGPERDDVLVAVGGVAYDLPASGDEGRSPGSRAASDVRADQAPFVELPGAEREVLAICERLSEASEIEIVRLGGLEASPPSVEEAARRARWLHLATHGYGTTDGGGSSVELESRSDTLDEHELVWMMPMLLTGLALSGANDARLGRSHGVVTAAQLATWDLDGCDLVVLSACDTARGIRRDGQGVASLQRAVLEAGADTVVASLWKVDDDATRALMERFYDYLWSEGQGPADALWKAKRDLRAEGHPVRDWAAWVLSGDPD